MNERRRQQRWPSLLGATAIINETSTLDCLIRDVSADGAHVVLGNTALLPLSFHLHVPCRGKTWRVALKWRRDAEAGVALEGVADSHPVLEREAEIRRLRREVHALRRQRDAEKNGF